MPLNKETKTYIFGGALSVTVIGIGSEILDAAACISLHADNFEKGMNRLLFPSQSSCDKTIGQTGFFSLV